MQKILYYTETDSGTEYLCREGWGAYMSSSRASVFEDTDKVDLSSVSHYDGDLSSIRTRRYVGHASVGDMIGVEDLALTEPPTHEDAKWVKGANGDSFLAEPLIDILSNESIEKDWHAFHDPYQREVTGPYAVMLIRTPSVTLFERVVAPEQSALGMALWWPGPDGRGCWSIVDQQEALPHALGIARALAFKVLRLEAALAAKEKGNG